MLMTRRHILTQTIAASVTARQLPRMGRKLDVVILAKRFEKHTPASHGLLDVARTSSSVSGSTMPSAWIPSGVRDAA